MFGVLGVLAVQLLYISLVSGLGEPALLIQQGEDAHGTLNQVNGGLQV